MNPVQVLQDTMIRTAIVVPLVCVFCVAIAYGVRCFFKRILDDIDGKSKDWK
jgi:ABC-type sulfate transport system permease subunit